MASTGLKGAFALTRGEIDRQVSRVSPGVYCLGEIDEGTFFVSYVGRADDNLNGRLKDHVGNYRHFKCDYFASPKAAFEKESQLYHDFNPPDNVVHPARPKGTTWNCPVRGCRAF